MPISNNKRIAKNTVFLYFRMILIILVTLYTSRVILEVLGVADFGVYNIVGGVVILFSFISTTLTTALQRYLNTAIGTGDIEYERKVYANSYYVLGLLSVIMVLLLETVGLWFVNFQLDIPAESRTAANIVYQLSILNFLVYTFRIPDNALVFANERMSFFAYTSIVESVLKLGVVFLLRYIVFNKLVLYAMLALGVTVVLNIVYSIYCRRQFRLNPEWNLDKPVAKELLAFNGWNILGGVADVGYQQGTNIILNIFFGVTLNATMGIANQVKNAVYNLSRNILSAANPQIFKLYATQQTGEFQLLVFRISKMAFFLYLMLALPLIFNINEVLALWLKDIPPMEGTFCVLMLVFCMIDSLIGPLWTCAQAEGDIKRYQIISSLILLLNLPFTWIAFRLGFPSYSLLVVQIGVVTLSLVYRILYLNVKRILSLTKYVRAVIIPLCLVATFSFAISLVIERFIHLNGLLTVMLSTFCIEIGLSVIVWFLGLNCPERNSLTAFLKAKLKGHQ